MLNRQSSEVKLLEESALSGKEEKEWPELDELEAREDEREMGEKSTEEGTEGNWVWIGVIQVGCRSSSATIANSSFSSSFSINCWAKVLLGGRFKVGTLGLATTGVGLMTASADHTVKVLPTLPRSQLPKRMETQPGSM